MQQQIGLLLAISNPVSHPSFKGFIGPIKWQHILVKNQGTDQEFQQQLKQLLARFLGSIARGSLASTRLFIVSLSSALVSKEALLVCTARRIKVGASHCPVASRVTARFFLRTDVSHLISAYLTKKLLALVFDSENMINFMLLISSEKVRLTNSMRALAQRRKQIVREVTTTVLAALQR